MRKVAEQSPSAVAACKSLIQVSHFILDKGRLLEREYFVNLFDTEDRSEGVSVFKKRYPQWKNA